MQIWKGTAYYNLRDKYIISFCRSSLPTSCWKTFWIIVPDTTVEALALCSTRQTYSPCFFPRGTPFPLFTWLISRPTNSVFLSQQISEQYFQSWLFSQANRYCQIQQRVKFPTFTPEFSSFPCLFARANLLIPLTKITLELMRILVAT
jgi:hypothetical protein